MALPRSLCRVRRIAGAAATALGAARARSSARRADAALLAHPPIAGFRARLRVLAARWAALAGPPLAGRPAVAPRARVQPGAAAVARRVVALAAGLVARAGARRIAPVVKLVRVGRAHARVPASRAAAVRRRRRRRCEHSAAAQFQDKADVCVCLNGACRPAEQSGRLEPFRHEGSRCVLKRRSQKGRGSLSSELMLLRADAARVQLRG